MVDVHCHLNFHSFEKDYDEVIKKAFHDGITTIINTGTQIVSSQDAVTLAEEYENLYAIVGIHPHHADKVTEGHPEPASPAGRQSEGSSNEKDSSPGKAKTQNDNNKNWLTDLERIAKHPKVVGIGECGLDYYSYKSNGIVDPKIQKEIFVAQIELAHKLKLPLQIHNRHAGEDVIYVLRGKKHLLRTIPGMFHCFAGSKEVLKDALDLGFYIGFDGNITYKGLAKGETVALSELARLTPMDRILTETDSPFLTPEPYRGSRNIPSYGILVAKFLAELKGVSFEEMKEQTTKNAQTVFKLN